MYTDPVVVCADDPVDDDADVVAVAVVVDNDDDAAVAVAVSDDTRVISQPHYRSFYATSVASTYLECLSPMTLYPYADYDYCSHRT